jgi:hypothetical protein
MWRREQARFHQEKKDILMKSWGARTTQTFREDVLLWAEHSTRPELAIESHMKDMVLKWMAEQPSGEEPGGAPLWSLPYLAPAELCWHQDGPVVAYEHVICQ